MNAAAVVWDAPAGRSRLSGSAATQVEPVVLMQGTRAVDRLGARLTPVSRTLADPWAARTGVIDTAQRLSTRATVEAAPWHDYVLGRFGQMLVEGEGREAYPDASVIGRAWIEVNSLFGPRTPTPSIVPSEESGVAFVWHKKGWDVEIEVNAVETTVWAHRRSDDTSWYGSLARNRERLVALLSEMARR